jgi:hypothetical protein
MARVHSGGKCLAFASVPCNRTNPAEVAVRQIELKWGRGARAAAAAWGRLHARLWTSEAWDSPPSSLRTVVKGKHFRRRP